MRYSFLILFYFISHKALCQDTSFTEKDFDSAKVYYKTSYIPKVIKENFTGGFEKFRMADTGKKFEVGCTGSAPHERLICLVSLKDRYLLYYEQGGRAYSTLCKLYEMSEGNVKATWDIVFAMDSNLSYSVLKEVLLQHQYALRKHD